MFQIADLPQQDALHLPKLSNWCETCLNDSVPCYLAPPKRSKNAPAQQQSNPSQIRCHWFGSVMGAPAFGTPGRVGVSIGVRRDGVTVGVRRGGVTVGVKRGGVTVDVKLGDGTVGVKRGGVTVGVKRGGGTVGVRLGAEVAANAVAVSPARMVARGCVVSGRRVASRVGRTAGCGLA